jgi:hypothetical protein
VVHLGIEWSKIETDLRALGLEDVYWIEPAQHGWYEHGNALSGIMYKVCNALTS